MHEQCFENQVNTVSDGNDNQSRLSNFAYDHMSPNSSFGCHRRDRSEPDALDLSVADPMSRFGDSTSVVAQRGLTQKDSGASCSQDSPSSESSNIADQFKNLLDCADKNGDSQLSKDELLKAFDQIDVNKDNQLDKTEIDQSLQPPKPSQSEHSGHCGQDSGREHGEASNNSEHGEAPSNSEHGEAPNRSHPEEHSEPATSPEHTDCGGTEQEPRTSPESPAPAPEQQHHEPHGGESGAGSGAADSAEQFRHLMKMMDQNGDGLISLAELLQTFQDMDENHDGLVSMEELQRLLSKDKTSGSPSAPSPAPSQPAPHQPSSDVPGHQPAPEVPTTPIVPDNVPPAPNDAPTAPVQPTPPEQDVPATPGEPVPSDQPTPPSDAPSRPTEPAGTQAAARFIHIFPKEQSWPRVISESPKGSIVVTLPSGQNWDNDRPFNSLDPALQQHIRDAGDAGLKPLGYVGTSGGTKPIEIIKAEIDSWYENSDVKGIYLGASANPNGGGFATDPASEAYFKEIARYIKSKGGFAAINGFGTPNPNYIGVFDLQNAAEGYASNYEQAPPVADFMKNVSADNFSAILLGVDRSQIGRIENRLINDHFGYVGIAPDFGIEAVDDDNFWRDVRDGLDGRMDGRFPN